MKKNKNKLIIGISGKIGSGKTTFSNLLSQELMTKYNLKVRFINFADKLKEICFILTGHRGLTQEDKQVFLPDWNKTVGQILQKLGTEVMRDNFDNDVWVKSTLSEIDRDNESDIFIIGDCRFENEAKAIKDDIGLVFRINGDPVGTRENSTRDINHASETSLDNYTEFDEIYENNKSLDDLKIYAENISAQVVNFMKYENFLEIKPN